MSAGELAAVLDAGKSKLRLTVFEREGGGVLLNEETPTPHRRLAGLPCLDVSGMEDWVLATLRACHEGERIGVLLPVAHGATAALFDARGHLLAVPDYEADEFESVADEYEAERDAYAETYSPSLPRGLNLGRQLHYLDRRPLEGSIDRIVPYAQFWASRFSGEFASEVTSLGCHTDLWRPAQRDYSHLAQRRDWSRRFPPLRAAGDTLGTITTAFAAASGLPRDCRVLCGLHDSNASFLALSHRQPQPPTAVVSSGTWLIVMAQGVPLSRLDERLDMLANVDAYGQPLATARFMGGREFEQVSGAAGHKTGSGDADLARVIEAGAFALPSFADAAGPFRGRPGALLRADRLDGAARHALASAYLAFVVDHMLGTLGFRGRVIVDGPLGANPLALAVLASLRHPDPVWRVDSPPASRLLAALESQGLASAPDGASVAPCAVHGLPAWHQEWRRQLR